MTAIPLFVELCAGLASMSLMLQHGKYCKPPVSRMGNKHGYALAILRVMDLRPGQRADSFLWCEPDPGCRALLTAYTDPALMREAADIIRGWKDEDPRELWERLRAEGPIKDFGAREVGRQTLLQGGSLRNKPVWFDGARLRTMTGDGELARYLQVTASNRLVNIDSTTMVNSGKGGTTFGGGVRDRGGEGGGCGAGGGEALPPRRKRIQSGGARKRDLRQQGRERRPRRPSADASSGDG